MYAIRTPNYRKRDPVLRWSLPDRVFFACGACHNLAHASLERYDAEGWRAVWIKPDGGHAGHSVFVGGEHWTFDFHGYAPPAVLANQWEKRARRRWPGLNATLVELPPGCPGPF